MIKTHVLATSVEGRPIHAYELVNDAPVIFVVAGIHGDEPQSAFVGDCIIELLKTRVGDLMDERLLVIPRLNPDGLERASRQNANRVDLNRNLPTANWKLVDETDPYYGGHMAASEPETQLILEIIRRFQPRRILAIHCIEPERSCINYDGPAEHLAKKMAAENNYEIRADIGYETPGSLGVWAGYERKIPTVTLELPENKHHEECWRENRDAILSFIQAEFT